MNGKPYFKSSFKKNSPNVVVFMGNNVDILKLKAAKGFDSPGK